MFRGQQRGINHKVVELLATKHAATLMKSTPVIKFLAWNNSLTSSHLDTLWAVRGESDYNADIVNKVNGLYHML
jgi:hypothetical protein